MTQRILLVEDDPVSRDLLASLLASRGYKVDTADDGFGALRLAQDEAYEVVFVDYHLPEMDGYALARLMRTLAEKSETQLKMVAITADRFGLAARRGVDSIFDRVLSKPIEPDALFAFAAEFLGPPAVEDTLDSFLAEPTTHDAQNAAQVLWRVRGLEALPAAAVFPAPSIAERDRLAYCFRLVEAEKADCLILLNASGLAGLEAHRASGKTFLQPLFVIDPALAAQADLLFTIGDGETWSSAAARLARVRERRQQLRPDAAGASDIATRLAAYLFVADRSLTLRRDAFGRTGMDYTGGFRMAAAIEAIKTMAGLGLVAAKPIATSDAGVRELGVSLTPKGLEQVAQPSVAMALSAG